jgi:phage gpG-like protein
MPTEWHGDEVLREIEDQMVKRLELASRSWVTHAKRKLIKKLNRPIKTKNGKWRSGNKPSRPGDYPAAATNNLLGKIESEVIKRDLKAFVGTNVSYGKFLELGTKRMGKRPWMKLTNDAMRSKIKRILGKPIK